ncbi:MAG: type II toxin-antitoxin system VapC family toxin [Solirubrobacterales bacterium]
MSRVFVDTGWFVAERSPMDANHQAARIALTELARETVELVTTNYVFAETYVAILVRAGRERAIEWGEQLRASDKVETVRVDPDLEDGAWSLLRSRADKRWSFVDATSFALMERDGVTEALTFDRHFAQAGFKMLPA